MKSVNRRLALKIAGSTTAALATPALSLGQTESYGPDDLKSVLTPFGGLRAGNADGTIPAWTGGYSTVPPGYQNGAPRLDPFADEKPTITITSANVDQYQSKLSFGITTLLKKYPAFRVDVYPTHRTAIAPQYVYDYIFKNASSAQLAADGNSVTGAYGGIPFPIPKNGHEAMWNHLLAWSGTTVHFVADAHTITSSGQDVLDVRAQVWFQYPYYFENGESRFNGFYLQEFIAPVAPPFEAGGSIVQLSPVNPTITPIEAWEYLQGERRVRRAPELQYDTPNSLAGGVTNWDEQFIFSGKLDRYDFKLLGMKELYVPYNTNKSWYATPALQFKTNFVNPDVVRWELHRVRVVEMTVKSGSRNVDARRLIYFDEDTGSAILGEIYDAAGSLWKVDHMMPAILPDIPCVQATQFFVTYDLHTGDYSAGSNNSSETEPQWKTIPELPNSFFTPGQLAASAGGF